MEFCNILSDHMEISWPPFILLIPTDTRIVQESVIPDIRHLSWIKRKWNPECIRFTRNRKILESSFYEFSNFIVSGRWNDKVRMFLIEIQKPVLVLRKSEKIILLFEVFESFVWVIWTDFFPIFFDKIRFFFERFTSYTIEPLINSLIDITTIIGFLEDFLNKIGMSLASCTDKIGITNRKMIPYLSMFSCHHICILHHFHTLD